MQTKYPLNPDFNIYNLIFELLKAQQRVIVSFYHYMHLLTFGACRFNVNIEDKNVRRGPSKTTEHQRPSDERPTNPGGFTAYPLLQFYSSYSGTSEEKTQSLATAHGNRRTV
jgi:hypothetical protein